MRKNDTKCEICKMLMLSTLHLSKNTTDFKNFESLYQQLEPILDPGMFQLYQKAKEMTGINIYYYFPTEDTLGYFEEMDGEGLLKWLIYAKFGEIVYSQLNPPYEKVESVNLSGKEEEIAEFKAELMQAFFEELLNKEE